MMIQILIFILTIIIDLITRLISPLLYPVSYIFRKYIRTNEIYVKEYMYKWRKGWFWLWIWLDDSILIENLNLYKTYADYCFSVKKYPVWYYNLFKNNAFMLSYWWAAIRNCVVNLNNYQGYKLGRFIKVIKSWGEESFTKLYENKKGFRLELREYSSGQRRLYLEFYLFKRWNQMGWLSSKSSNACNRFETDILKKR